MRKDMEQVWAWASERACLWFDQCATLDGLLDMAEEHVTRSPIGLESGAWPRPALVASMVSARLGDERRARAHLEFYLELGNESDTGTYELRQVLERLLDR